MHVAGLAAGAGPNLLGLLDADLPGVEVTVVLSADPDAAVLDAARDRGVATEVLDGGDTDRDGDGGAGSGPGRDAGGDRDARVGAAVREYGADLLCCDGVRPPSPSALPAGVEALAVHPSLLPAFGDAADPVAAALAAGVRTTGATVHLATDGGGRPPVTQEPVPVFEGDDAPTLRARIREEGTARAYPRAVAAFAAGAVSVGRPGPGAGGDAREGGTGGPDDRGTGVVVTVDTDRLAGRFAPRRGDGTDRRRELRYGENPHQSAALYVDRGADRPALAAADGSNPTAKELSFNNYNDADAALGLVREFPDPAAAVIKHGNPAGCAVAGDVATAYDRALATDPMSAFGGVVAANRTVDAETARSVVDSFKEVVVAPGYTDDARAVLHDEGNLRVLAVPGADRPASTPADDGAGPPLVDRRVAGGRLVQERDDRRLVAGDLTVVTDRDPTDDQVAAMLFAWGVAKHVRSNAIVLATGAADGGGDGDGTASSGASAGTGKGASAETVGVGAGQMSRVDAVRIAAMKAEEHAEDRSAEGAVLASDGFFPFPDGIERAAEAGVEAVVQPGGSVNDDDVTERADELGLAMAHTGVRGFRH